MGFDAFSKITTASDSVSSAIKSLTKRWDRRKEVEAADAALREAIRRKQTLLTLIASKTSAEMPPLTYTPQPTTKAVFLVTTPIAFGRFALSETSYSLLARHVGMSLESVSHWAVCVVDRGLGACWGYDLMSDRLEVSMLGRNYFRVYEVDGEGVEGWSGCFYVGETGRTHEEIQEAGRRHTTLNPRYSLLSSNCQHLVDALVKDLCDGRTISQAKLDEELALASPKIARDLLVARLRSKMDVDGERGDSETVVEDAKLLRELWEVVRKR